MCVRKNLYSKKICSKKKIMYWAKIIFKKKLMLQFQVPTIYGLGPVICMRIVQTDNLGYIQNAFSYAIDRSRKTTIFKNVMSCVAFFFANKAMYKI